MEDKMYYMAVSSFNETRTGNNFEEMKEKVDKWNESPAPKWYIIEFTDDAYHSFIDSGRRDFTRSGGTIVYDPEGRVQYNEETRFYREHFVRRFGSRHGDHLHD